MNDESHKSDPVSLQEARLLLWLMLDYASLSNGEEFGEYDIGPADELVDGDVRLWIGGQTFRIRVLEESEDRKQNPFDVR